LAGIAVRFLQGTYLDLFGEDAEQLLLNYLFCRDVL
jgi:hypothetical protein